MSNLSLIEQATKRLEELKRSGVEIIQPASKPEGAGAAAKSAAGRMPSKASALAATARTPVIESPRAPDVEIDLERLSRLGYLVPAQSNTELSSEFRHIKRPLLRNVDRQNADPSNRTSLILMTSAIAGEGKTFCAINLAMSIALEVDTSVLLVDADVVRPAVLERLGLASAKGLLDVLSEEAELSEVILRTNVPKLSILPAGAPRPMATELLASEAMDNLLIELATRYEDRVIVLDAPPLLLTTESPVLASRAGQVVIVIDSLRTSRQKVAQAFATVESCPIVLSLLNKCHKTEPSDGYGYSYK